MHAIKSTWRVLQNDDCTATEQQVSAADGRCKRLWDWPYLTVLLLCDLSKTGIDDAHSVEASRAVIDLYPLQEGTCLLSADLHDIAADPMHHISVRPSPTLREVAQQHEEDYLQKARDYIAACPVGLLHEPLDVCNGELCEGSLSCLHLWHLHHGCHGDCLRIERRWHFVRGQACSFTGMPSEQISCTALLRASKTAKAL